MRTKKFPENLFVTWFEDGDHALLPSASESLEAALEQEEQEVATYRLVEVKRGKLVPEVH
jgi:hypothetical protein